MIDFRHGDLFKSQATALVNTVNCVGVMGKGIAHHFKQAYPAMFADYAGKCRRGEIQLGQVDVFKAPNRVIVNFPTKGHWRAKSRLKDIDAGLKSLREMLLAEGIDSVAIPPLGCGNGGLEWSDVRPLIQKHLGNLEGVEVEVYEPQIRGRADRAERSKLSLEHVILARLGMALQARKSTPLLSAAYFLNVYAGSSLFSFKLGEDGLASPGIQGLSRGIRAFQDAHGTGPEVVSSEGVRSQLSGRDIKRLEALTPAVKSAAGLVNDHFALSGDLARVHATLAERGQCSVAALLKLSGDLKGFKEAGSIEEVLKVLEAEGLVEPGVFGWGVRPGPHKTRERPSATARTLPTPVPRSAASAEEQEDGAVLVPVDPAVLATLARLPELSADQGHADRVHHALALFLKSAS